VSRHSPIVRRPASLADLPEVLALAQASDVVLIGESDWTEADLREEWDEYDLERDVFLLELGGRLAGYAAFERRGSSGRMLADGYVHPELTGRGVGAEQPDRTSACAAPLDGAADGVGHGLFSPHDAQVDRGLGVGKGGGRPLHVAGEIQEVRRLHLALERRPGFLRGEWARQRGNQAGQHRPPARAAPQKRHSACSSARRWMYRCGELKNSGCWSCSRS